MWRFSVTVSFVCFILRTPLCTSFSSRSQTLLNPRAARFNQSRRQDALTTVPSPSALASQPDASIVAEGLGYLVGAGSFLLYTPIAVRIVRQSSADGLTMSTWWIKLISYTCTILYSYTQGYPISTYAETVVITTEAALILFLVAYYQRSLDTKFYSFVGLFIVAAAVALVDAPPAMLALGQGASSILNVAALLPQFALNARLRTAGDYSPITALLASLGCSIRIFTTYQLAGSDPLLLGSYGLALLINGSLLAQILYYGVRVEGKTFLTVMSADMGTTQGATTTTIEVEDLSERPRF